MGAVIAALLCMTSAWVLHYGNWSCRYIPCAPHKSLVSWGSHFAAIRIEEWHHSQLNCIVSANIEWWMAPPSVQSEWMQSRSIFLTNWFSSRQICFDWKALYQICTMAITVTFFFTFADKDKYGFLESSWSIQFYICKFSCDRTRCNKNCLSKDSFVAIAWVLRSCSSPRSTVSGCGVFLGSG